MSVFRETIPGAGDIDLTVVGGEEPRLEMQSRATGTVTIYRPRGGLNGLRQVARAVTTAGDDAQLNHGWRPLILLESPFAGDTQLHEYYARVCMEDSLRRGEAPFASHLLYPQVLNDDEPQDREMGIRAGLAWGRAATMTAVYTDLGISHGMREGIRAAEEAGRQVDYRSIPWWGEAKK
jgi:hypothetical protein